ncbi:MAG TPA: 3-phosphoshikimate 1-carboxyvinyltransferase [Anaerolineales bacterium]|nr:3-phosphoshikimate 1-carboxyvinyltransferase [Anaerolineales bacterium]
MKLRGPAGALRGSTELPGDKSISHRALLHAAVSPHESRLQNVLRAGVTAAMIDCLQKLGVSIEGTGSDLSVRGGAWQQPTAPLDCGNSGTTMRLLLGALAGMPLQVELTGTPGLQCRPMGRVTRPLREMGASISADNAPLSVNGGGLRGSEHHLPVASAQVKAALLLAALHADGPTTIHQPAPSRDHSERMLRELGIDVRSSANAVRLHPSRRPLPPTRLTVPGDFSSAAFLIAAAVLLPGSAVRLRGVGVNPTRTGLLDALNAMGADISIENWRESGGEPVADITARHSRLRSVKVRGDLVVRMIDEFPIFAVLATQAEGVTVVRDAAELRVKESDRISALAAELQRMGIAISERPDGFDLSGPQQLSAATVDSHADHRLAMSLAVAALLAPGDSSVQRAGAAHESFPAFAHTLRALGVEVR